MLIYYYVVCLAKDLRDACDRRDVKDIENMIKDIKKMGFAENLENELRDARYVREAILRPRRPRAQFRLELDRKTMTEMRRYHKPSPLVHDVMKGVLLLLGEDEDATEVSSNLISTSLSASEG